MKMEQLLYGMRFHLPSTVVDDVRAFILGQIKDIFSSEAAFEKLLGLIGPLMPADHPVDRLSRELVKEQIQK